MNTHHKRTDIEFAKDLAKGKMAELVFEQMFRNIGTCMILPCGYEKTTAPLAQYINKMTQSEKQALKNTRSTPDYILLAEDGLSHWVHVEVKYIGAKTLTFLKERAKEIATQINKKWENTYLFIATPLGFFWGDCEKLANSEIEIISLPKIWISEDKQREFLTLLQELIRGL